MRSVFVQIAIICSVLICASCKQKTDYGPGAVAPQEPRQDSLWNPDSIKMGEYLITPLADYEITARVLLRTTYWLGREADISPIDLTLAWGRLSDESIINQIQFSSGDRRYFWSAATLPVPQNEINDHVANTHLVPANDAIEATLKAFRISDVVSLKGYLIKAEAPDGWNWHTSLTRSDSGTGACELMYVTNAVRVSRP